MITLEKGLKMIKAIIGVAISLLVCVLGGLVLGFWKLWDIAPLWLSISSLAVFVLLIVAFALMVVKLLADVKAWLNEVFAKLKAFVDGLPKWVKKLLGIK